MGKEDNEFLLEHWKLLVEQLIDVNKSLRELVEAQHQIILKLQGVQQNHPKLPNDANRWYQ